MGVIPGPVSARVTEGLPRKRSGGPSVEGGKFFVSYLLYDFLTPLMGPSAAEYWAKIFVVGPL